MSAVEHLRLVEDPAASPEGAFPEGASPKPFEARAAPPPSTTGFTRVISTPAAWPWRQQQMAALDARLGAPLPIEQLHVRVRRLDPWRRGQAARFAATYVRAAGVTRSLFPGGPNLSKAIATSPLRQALPHAALWLVALLLTGLALVTGFHRRQDGEDTLAALERRAGLQVRAAHQLVRRKADARLLDEMQARQRSSEQVLRDLAWLSQHRRGDVAVEGFHWKEGIAALEVASPNSPFQDVDRRVERAGRPVRPGVWLWGVERQAAGRSDGLR